MLPPTMRERKRYIAFKVISDEEIEFGNLVSGLWHSLLNLMGEFETAKCNVWVVKDKWNDKKQIGLVKCNHNHVKHVRSALALIEMLGDIKVIIKTLGVSGTMRGAEKKFFGEKKLTDF
ncbi:MAG: Rpp14/Pop5 family protein [Candidatus Aenigmatarchaeota archaeon]